MHLSTTFSPIDFLVSLRDFFRNLTYEFLNKNHISNNLFQLTREQFAVVEFANALLCIPKILAHNAVRTPPTLSPYILFFMNLFSNSGKGCHWIGRQIAGLSLQESEWRQSEASKMVWIQLIFVNLVIYKVLFAIRAGLDLEEGDVYDNKEVYNCKFFKNYLPIHRHWGLPLSTGRYK